MEQHGHVAVIVLLDLHGASTLFRPHYHTFRAEMGPVGYHGRQLWSVHAHSRCHFSFWFFWSDGLQVKRIIIIFDLGEVSGKRPTCNTVCYS